MKKPDSMASATAALQAGLSAQALRRKILLGEIKGSLRDGKYFADRDSLQQWIARNRERQPARGPTDAHFVGSAGKD